MKRSWIWPLPFMRPSIAEMKQRGDVDGLVAALTAGHYSTRREAEAALVDMGSAAVERLIAELNSASDKRVQALRILGRFGDDRAVEAVVTTLTDQAVDMRLRAAMALAPRKDRRSVLALCRALADDDAQIRHTAFSALERNADGGAVGTLSAVAASGKAAVHAQTLLRSILDRMAETVSTEDLRAAARLNDSYVMIFAQVETSCSFTAYNVHNGAADFSQIKQMARQELIRRGLEA